MKKRRFISAYVSPQVCRLKDKRAKTKGESGEVGSIPTSPSKKRYHFLAYLRKAIALQRNKAKSNLSRADKQNRSAFLCLKLCLELTNKKNNYFV
jgi:hypothetical protein